VKQAFRQPGFTRLYAGLTASMFGDSVMLLVRRDEQTQFLALTVPAPGKD